MCQHTGSFENKFVHHWNDPMNEFVGKVSENKILQVIYGITGLLSLCILVYIWQITCKTELL